jgi:hypothetical protein
MRSSASELGRDCLVGEMLRDEMLRERRTAESGRKATKE